MNSEKGDEVTVVTVHGHVSSRPESRVLSVPVCRTSPVSELSSEELAQSRDLVRLSQTQSSDIECSWAQWQAPVTYSDRARAAMISAARPRSPRPCPQPSGRRRTDPHMVSDWIELEYWK